MNQNMRAYLDEPFSRLGTHSVKWDGLERSFGRSDLIPMWVADMDFRTVPQVRDAIVHRAEHAIYGYTDYGDEARSAEVDWLARRHGLKVEPDWILNSPGVVDSMHFCVHAFTQEGDRILIQPPVYGPFYDAARAHNRQLVYNPLLRDGNGWRMDFDGLEARLAEGVKMMFLCNPHNPVGRAWHRDELQRVVDLTNRYGVLLVADEIHAEFVFDGRRVTRTLSLDNAEGCIMLSSATKSFNLAGLRQSTAIVPDPEKRECLRRAINSACAGSPNLFGIIAQTAAYRYGDEWMDAVVEYIGENRDFAAAYIRENIPELRTWPQEGTYLMWVDFNALGMAHEDIKAMLVNQAHVAVSEGLFFGEEGRGWIRLNLATQRANVAKALENIRDAIRSR